MLLRNSLRLLMDNFKNVYKILLYKLIVGIIATALCLAMILPEIMEIMQSQPAQELKTQGGALISAFFTANHTALVQAKNAIFGASGILHKLGQLIVSKATGIVLSTVGCLLILLLKRFADALCYFSIGSVINDKMSKYSEARLSLAYVANFKKACKYALVYVPVAFVFDILSIVVAFVLMQSVGIFIALFLSVTSVVVLQSVKFICTWRWMPAMITDEQRLFTAIKSKDKTEKKQRGTLFSNYIVAVYIVIVLNVAGAIFTFGSALILTVPMSYLLFVCTHFVQYYTVNGKRYFITFDRIEQNPDHGDSEHFFQQLAEQETLKEAENKEE